MVGCPVGSIRRRGSLEVVIEDWCIGCGLCAENCPYGSISMHPVNLEELAPAAPAMAMPAQRASVKQKATSCDLCAGMEEPSCVYACPHDAAHRVDAVKFFGDLVARGVPESTVT
jgi:Fe-S-cluster-containing hydrogenase component 2